MNSLTDVLQLLAVLAVVAWAIWKVWQQGVRQAKAFDADERCEKGLCPECGYDLRGGTGDRCPECGADLSSPPPPGPAGPQPTLDPRRLAHDWPETPIEPVAPHPGAELVLLHDTRSGTDARLLHEQLLARGVWCRLEQRQEFAQSGGFALRFPVYSVLVPPDEFARAEVIVHRFRLTSDGGEHEGGRCGEQGARLPGPTITHGEVHDPPQRG